MAYLKNVTLGDGPQIDAFGRLRVGSPESLFVGNFQYDVSALAWESITATGGTVAHVAASSAAQLAATGSSGSLASVQSLHHHRYYPGRSQAINMTFVFGAAVANVRRRAGYFDSGNGVFIEQNGTSDVAMVIRSSTSGSPVDTRVVQASWNEDRLDGTGPSGITLDLSKAQIFHIDAQWLGVGRVRVGLVIGGALIYVHQFNHANSVVVPYTRTFSLPVKYEIESTSASAGASMLAICSNVVCEGGQTFHHGNQFSTSNGITAIAVTGRRAILSLRPKATFNSITNRIQITVEEVDTYQDSNGYFELIYNPTFTGTPTWTSADANSGAEFSIHNDGANGAITGGMRIHSWYGTISGGAGARGNSQAAVLSEFPLVLNAAGTSPIALSVVATSFTATCNSSAAMQWKESR